MNASERCEYDGGDDDDDDDDASTDSYYAPTLWYGVMIQSYSSF